MFDIGFSEILVIAVVALVVIGPERLPSVARTLGHLFGRLQRYVNDVKADINREMELDALRTVKTEFEQAAQSVASSVRDEVAATESTINSIAGDLQSAQAAEPVVALAEIPPPAEPAPEPGAEPAGAPAGQKTAI